LSSSRLEILGRGALFYGGIVAGAELSLNPDRVQMLVRKSIFDGSNDEMPLAFIDDSGKNLKVKLRFPGKRFLNKVKK